MGVPTAFASLSAGLLARKGAARPAMRQQGHGQFAAAAEDLGWDDMGFEPLRPSPADLHVAEHDGSRERALEPAIRDQLARLTPPGASALIEPSPVQKQQAKIAAHFAADERATGSENALPVLPGAEEAARPAELPRGAPQSRASLAFTLRLDPARHFKLRLACAVKGRSAQMLVCDAVDRLLDTIPELDAMVSKARSPR